MDFSYPSLRHAAYYAAQHTGLKKKKKNHCIFSAFPQEGGIYAITGQENRWLYEHVA